MGDTIITELRKEPKKEVRTMKKIEMQYNECLYITMEQQYKGGKVKITIRNQMPWERRTTKETLWVGIDDANNFYKKKLRDGYKVVA